jgi:chaperonin GroEL (HSP60 family)
MTGGMVVREADLMSFHSENEEDIPDLNNYIGQVEKISIGPDTTLIKGFFNRNDGMYELAIRDAKSKYAKLEQTHQELNIVDSQLYEVKKRLSKLKGIMGVIHVGGQSGLEKTSNFDLVEDAVKACESAYNYGYNIGGNLIIPISIGKLLKEKYSDESHERVVLSLLYQAFIDVFTKVLENKFTEATTEELEAIARQAVNKQQCYDLIKDVYSSDVINPCHTDIEILRAATSIVSLLLSSNQYISISVDTDSTQR